MVVLYKPKYYIHIILHGKLIFKDFNCIPNFFYLRNEAIFKAHDFSNKGYFVKGLLRVHKKKYSLITFSFF